MVNLKGVVNLGVKIRLLEIAVLLNWKLKIPSSEWPLRRCQNAIRDYFQALRLIKLISQLKISKSTQFHIYPKVYDWSEYTCIIKVKEPEMD